jgi:hypothetical protein
MASTRPFFGDPFSAEFSHLTAAEIRALLRDAALKK